MSKLGVPGYQTSDIDAPEIADKLTGAVPQATIVMCHIGGVLGYCAYAGRNGEIHGGTGGSPAQIEPRYRGRNNVAHAVSIIAPSSI